MGLRFTKNGITNGRRRPVLTAVYPPAGVGRDAAGLLPAAPAGTLRSIPLSTDPVIAQAQFDAALPGDSFIVQDGLMVWEDQPELHIAGTVDHPISIRGSSSAIWTTGDYGVHVTAAHNQLLGFTLKGWGPGNEVVPYLEIRKGIVFDDAPYGVVEQMTIENVRQECIHFRSSSHHGRASRNTILVTGLGSPGFGEAFYIGSAHSNWTATYTTWSGQAVAFGASGAGVDRSDYCTIEYNLTENITGEGVDYKEGTVGAIIRGNYFYATGWSDANSADSEIDLKGSGALVAENHFIPTMRSGLQPTNPDDTMIGAPNALLDCIQTHRIISGKFDDADSASGTGNSIRANVHHGARPGRMVQITPTGNPQQSYGNIVYADNQADGCALGLANIPSTA